MRAGRSVSARVGVARYRLALAHHVGDPIISGRVRKAWMASKAGCPFQDVVVGAEEGRLVVSHVGGHSAMTKSSRGFPRCDMERCGVVSSSRLVESTRMAPRRQSINIISFDAINAWIHWGQAETPLANSADKNSCATCRSVALGVRQKSVR